MLQINYSPLFEPRRGVIPLRCKVISRRSVCRLVNAGWVVTSARVFRFRGYCLVAYKEDNQEKGTVVFFPNEEHPGDQWRVDYGTGYVSRLCLQIGDKGRGVVE